MAGKNIGRLSIKVIPDTAEFRADVKKMIERVEKTMIVHLNVAANTREAELTLARFRSQESKNAIRVTVAASTAVAKAQLAVLARDRFLALHVRLDQLSLVKASTALARLSGFRVAKNILTDVTNALKRIDLNVPKIARVSLAIGVLSAATLTASAGLVTLTGDIAKMGNTLFLMPALLSGMAVGVITLIMALKDSKTQLAVLAPAMHELQDSMSAKFWAKAKAPIVDFVQSVLPQAREGFALTATALGNQAAAVSDAFKETFSNGVLLRMFEKLGETMDIITRGATGFAEALTTLGTVGSNYLPRLAEWLVKIGDQFNTWLQRVAASGELDAFIEDGITQMKLFGASIADIVRIFKGIDKAATAAGGGGLTTFAANMKGAAEAIHDPMFQLALTQILSGANGAMDGLGKGFTRFGEALQGMAPTIGTVLTLAGEAVGGLFGSISDAMNTPEFRKGLLDFFTGIKSGVDALGPAMVPLFAFLGQLGTTVGALAAVIGPVLAEMKITFAPVLDAILAAVTPLIPMLGGLLVGAIEKLGPPMKAFSDFLKGNPALIAGAVLVIGGLALAIKGVSFALLIAGWVKNTAAMLISKAQTIILMGMYAKDFVVAIGKKIAGLALSTLAWVRNTAAAVLNKLQMLLLAGILGGAMLVALAKSGVALAIQTGKWILNTAAQAASKVALVAGAVAMGIATAAQWALNVAMSANPIALIVIAIAALVAGLIWFFTQTEVGKEAWANFTRFLGEAWDNIVGFVQDAIANVVSFVTDHWGLLLSLLIGPLGLVIQWIVENWSGIVQFFSEVWANIVAFVTTAINVILAVIVAIGAGIAAVWGAIWNGIVAAVLFVWTAIVALVTFYINLIVSVFTAIGAVIAAVWGAVWNGISAAVMFVWNAIIAAVTFYINLIVGVITAIGATIAAIWNGIWTGIGKFLSDTWTAIVHYIAVAIALVQARIALTLAIIKAVWNAIWQALGKAVSTAWEAIKSVVTGMVDGIKDTIGKIGAFIGGIKDKVLDAVSNAGTWLKDAGTKIVQGLIDGIGGMIQKVKDIAGKVMGAIADFFPHSPAKEGPFSGKGWTLYSGQAMAEGLADGIDSRLTVVRKSAFSMMGAAATGVARIGVDAAVAGIDLSRGIGSGDQITVMGDVGYDPAAIAAELNLKKRQAAMMSGLSRVAVA